MSNFPTFFFSHTRQDRETGNYLDQFFKDLEARVAQYGGVDLEVERVGMIDRKVRQGADWDRDLSGPLSTDRAFVAIMTPFYFKRENCGKELFAFVLRSKKIGIDTNGALTDVENVLPIRWLEEEVYYANTKKDSLIPPILRRINDTPDDEGGDPDRTLAIQRYRKKGMEWCVTVEPHYTELLKLFALRIRDLVELPAASSISFANTPDAFTYDWKHHFATAATEPPPSLPAEPVVPRPLASVVAFYITNRPFTLDPNVVDFADQLIAEPPAGASAVADAFNALLADVRAAGVAEGFTVFHAAANPAMPTSPESLLARLSPLSESLVITALVVDPSVWPGAEAVTPGAEAVEQIIRSPKWMGPVLLPSLDGSAINVDKLVKALDLPSRLVAVPQASDARVSVLRRAFVDARGLLLRTGITGGAPTAEVLPVLKIVDTEGT